VPLTFNARDVDLRSAPHVDAMVINCSVAGWDLHKVLVDKGSQADIIFLHAFDRMGISHSLLKPSDNPLYGFGGKGTFPVGKIELPLSFGVAPNARSEQVTFDIVDMVYPYNAIMGRSSINKFEAAIHGLYLCMKITGPQGMITVYGNQQTACNIERDFVPGQRNVHYLTTQRKVSEVTCLVADEKVKAQLQSNDGTKTVPLDPATPKQTVVISEDLTSRDEEKLISCLSRNKDVFAWSALDLVGVSRSIIEHGLGIDPSVRPKKQQLRKMSDEKIEAAKPRCTACWKPTSSNQSPTLHGSPMWSWYKRKATSGACASISPALIRPVPRTISHCRGLTKLSIAQLDAKSCPSSTSSPAITRYT
jgi:copper chaperone CopZ